MILKSFRATDFRNIERCKLDFDGEVNVLLGENAQGKTNAVEGIYMFARGRSFRRGDEKDLVRFGTEGFSISIEYEDRNGTNTLEYAAFGRERRRKKNGYKLARASDMVGHFKAVLFSPDDLELVKGGPEKRREFLNVAISQCYPEYLNIYAYYKKALENRNAILKAASKGLYFSEDELIAWSGSIADYAARIYSYRCDYLKKLQVYADAFMRDISVGKETLTLTYKSDVDECDVPTGELKERYQRIFSENIAKERVVGTTLYGPHREDIVFSLGGRDARIYASQGQQRSIVLALKMAEGEVSRDLFSEYPVFLFDDVLSELDETRQSFVLSGMKDRQIIITSCERLRTGGRVIEVKDGAFL